MITEDFVSFETAKLLKERGFDKRLDTVYSKYGNLHRIFDKEFYESTNSFITLSNSNYNDITRSKYEFFVTAPTLQMAMKWLRETHNLVIEPYRTACGYLYTISSIPYGSTKYDNSQAFNGDDEDSGQWTTWEKACEDGIKYCLKNLI